MMITAVGFGPLGLFRVEFSGSAAVDWNSAYMFVAGSGEAHAGPKTSFEATCACGKMGF